MKKLIAIVILTCSAYFVNAQNQGNTYMFTGKLISTPSNVPACTNNDQAAAYEFEITFFSDESYTQQNIAIVIACPESFGANFFKVDANYKMELFDATASTYTIVNQTVLDGYNLGNNFYAGFIKRL